MVKVLIGGKGFCLQWAAKIRNFFLANGFK